MSSRSSTKLGFEDADAPIVCETCLGSNPFVRMSKQPLGRPCKICERPFAIFRWSPGPGCKFKKTEICQSCSQLKNVCQTCLLDMETGLPTQVRDTVLDIPDSANVKSDSSRAFFEQRNAILALPSTGGNAGLLTAGENPSMDLVAGSGVGKAVSQQKLELARMARKSPYEKRNLAKVCTFYARGKCNRGEECPYRHEMPAVSAAAAAAAAAATQSSNGGGSKPKAIGDSFKDRFYGKNDEVAERILEKRDERRQQADEKAKQARTALLQPPADESVAALFVTGLTDSVTDEALYESFKDFGGEIKSIIVSRKVQCAFVNFVSRFDAEQAAVTIASLATGRPTVVVNGVTVGVQWAKPKNPHPSSQSHQQQPSQKTQPQRQVQTRQPSAEPPLEFNPVTAQIPLPPGATEDDSQLYPSQNGNAYGTRLATQQKL